MSESAAATVPATAAAGQLQWRRIMGEERHLTHRTYLLAVTGSDTKRSGIISFYNLHN
jgi:hypothetical protein